MIRLLYVWLLRIHPRRFRERFAEEMLWIFDQAAGPRSVIRLFADGVLSLGRQWMLRDDFRKAEAPVHAYDGVPMFYTSDDFFPGTGALIQGAILSVVVFAGICFALSHSGTRRILHLPDLTTRNPGNPASSRQGTSESLASLFGTQTSKYPADIIMATLDTDHDGVITQEELSNSENSLSELMNSSATLKVLLDREDLVVVKEVPSPADHAGLIMAKLDKNGDGVISQSERSTPFGRWLQDLLDNADRDQDGLVTAEELTIELASRRDWMSHCH